MFCSKRMPIVAVAIVDHCSKLITNDNWQEVNWRPVYSWHQLSTFSSNITVSQVQIYFLYQQQRYSISSPTQRHWRSIYWQCRNVVDTHYAPWVVNIYSNSEQFESGMIRGLMVNLSQLHQVISLPPVSPTPLINLLPASLPLVMHLDLWISFRIPRNSKWR